VLLAAPKANEYYPKVGFEHNPRAWVLRGGEPGSQPDLREKPRSLVTSTLSLFAIQNNIGVFNVV